MKNHTHVLVVEDEPEIRSALSDLLGMFGFDVATSATGQNGLNEVLAHRPDVLLLDINLPDMDGYHVLHEIRERERSRGAHEHLPVLIMTGRGLPTKVLCETEGIDGFLNKPFGRGELLDALARVLGKDVSIEEQFGN